MLEAANLSYARPPCSVAERDASAAVATALRGVGCRPALEALRAPTSPTWVPLIRALLRVWAAAFLAASLPYVAAALAGIGVIAAVPAIGGLVRFVPLLGAITQNVVVRARGVDPEARPLIVTAHVDTHPTAGTPMHRVHATLSGASGWLALIAAVATRSGAGWRPAAGLVAAEAVITLTWLARRELALPTGPPDDNTSGLLALVRVAELACERPPARTVWIVATGAGTSGSYGFTSFLRGRPDLRRAWVVEIDALGAGEVVASPFTSRFPHPGTPTLLVRALESAARDTGDPLSVRRVRRPHSDARAALRLRVPAIALTGGLRPPAGESGPDAANAERAARVVDRLARSAA